MKRFTKRGISILLVLCLCVSMLSGLAFSASAASYTYNWGQRGTVAEELSDAAVAWYSKYNVEYSDLSSLSGSSSTSSVPSSSLYNELKSLMTTAHSYKTSYEATKDMYQYTDCQNGGGKISSFYSGTAIGPGWGEGGSWNREHTWPNSKGLGGQDENDIMMLRPTATSENSSRGNTAYGESGGFYDPNDESGGKYNLHGDVARIVLYTYTRWGNTSYMWGDSGVMESKEVLLKWMEEDPVDTWELGRNDAVQSITGTRNVYVDYPELAFLLFNEDVPADYTTPSGEGNATNYTITAKSNNTAYGTVSLSGKTITATPKTGYYVTGYTVTSGTATVTQSDNIFRVSAQSDCTITINFAPKTAVTMTFMENGTVGSTVASYGGDNVTLPSNKNTPAEGYSFIGWTDATVTDTTEKPVLYAAGSSVKASNKTYYAVYTYSVGGTGVTEYVLKDITEIKTGDVFVITSATSSTVYALPNETVSKGPEGVVVTVSGDKLTSEPASNLLWNLGGSANAWEFYPYGVTSRWLASANDNNGMSVGTGTNKTYKINSDYLYNIGTERYVGVYTNNPDWRCYTSINSNISNQTLGFYVKTESGVLYYTTSTFVCKHESTTNTAAVAATCTTTGYTAGVYCNDCQSYISGHEVTAALGHNWGTWVQTTAPTCTAAGVETATCSRCLETKTQSVAPDGHDYEGVVTKPTETTQGYTTYTCSVCGDSYVSDYTDALGETFYVSFSVPSGVAAVATMTCNKDGITLPTAGAPEGYSFLGWTTAPVEDTETQPQILTGNYKATGNTTLYALYSYVVGGTGVSVYKLVTDATQLSAGAKLVMASNTKNVVAGAISSQYMGKVAATFSSDKTTLESLPDGAVVLTLDGSVGAWTFANENGKLLGATSVKKLAWGSGTTTWSIAIDSNGGATIQNGTSTYGAFRYNSGSPRFTTYTSAVNESMLLPQLYMLENGGTTWYTTLKADPVAAVGENEYATFEEAYAACGENQYIRLLRDTTAELILESDLYIDMNGCDLTGLLEPDTYTVYGMDSVKDAPGLFNCTDLDDQSVIPATFTQTDITGEPERFMAIASDGGYRFHWFYLGITHLSLSTATTGIGYKAVFHGSDQVLAQLDETQAFGYSLRLEGGNTVTRHLASITSGQVVSLRVNNFDVPGYGETALYAKVWVKLGGTVIESTEHSVTMRQLVETVNDSYTNYTAQLDALSAFVEKHYDTMRSWRVENLYQPE